MSALSTIFAFALMLIMADHTQLLNLQILCLTLTLIPTHLGSRTKVSTVFGKCWLVASGAADVKDSASMASRGRGCTESAMTAQTPESLKIILLFIPGETSSILGGNPSSTPPITEKPKRFSSPSILTLTENSTASSEPLRITIRYRAYYMVAQRYKIIFF